MSKESYNSYPFIAGLRHLVCVQDSPIIVAYIRIGFLFKAE